MQPYPMARPLVLGQWLALTDQVKGVARVSRVDINLLNRMFFECALVSGLVALPF